MATTRRIPLVITASILGLVQGSLAFKPRMGVSLQNRVSLSAMVSARTLVLSTRSISMQAEGVESGSIYLRVNSAIKDAMRAKEAAKLTALRNIKAAMLVALKEEGAGDDLPDAKAVPILRRLVKMRRESIDMYEKVQAVERIAEEMAELVIIEAYLPTLASEAQTRVWVAAAIAASPPGADAGRVMGMLMKSHKDDIDGKLAQKLVKEMIV